MNELEREGNSARKMGLPITLTLLGIGAISVAFMLAARPDTRRLGSADNEEEGYDVENFDIVKDKPFIYSICE